MYEKIEYDLKHHYGCLYWCIYWAWDLCCLELQNSSRIMRHAIGSMVYKHVGVWCIYSCCAVGLYCDKSNYQTQAEKYRLTNYNLAKECDCMKYLPIMSELFSSDSIFFLLIGVAVAFAVGLILKSDKKRTVGMVVSIIVYALCEVVSNIPAPFLVEIIALLVGTIAIGSFIGFLVALAVSKIKNKK